MTPLPHRHVRWLWTSTIPVLVLASAWGAPLPIRCEEPEAKKPHFVTTVRSSGGRLVRKWDGEGTSAGNVGDFYDNRDRGHSELNLELFPDITKIEYTEEERQRRLDWALQQRVIRRVVFGNSSTSAGVRQSGSNARTAYSHPLGLQLLYAQYRSNNLYVYPEHRDHDPGHNGIPSGYGDVFPTNTPYVLISQGSSGSDRPFLQAIALTLAAFRPEVKTKLVESGLLMPTIQLLFRRTGKQIDGPDEYLTPRAHPTAFEGSWIDEEELVWSAHELRVEDIPPLISLRVVEESQSIPGVDFFDRHSGETLGDTPSVVARIHRNRYRDYRLVVSAEDSADINERPLEFQWVVLRGDPERIRLRPEPPSGSRCEIVIPWHDRRPIWPDSELESNRVDIGVFANNGVYPSAPGFVTLLHADDEMRTFSEDGRPLEIGYGSGFVDVKVSDSAKLIELLGPEGATIDGRLLRERLSPEALEAIRGGSDTREEAVRAAIRGITTSPDWLARHHAAIAEELDPSGPSVIERARRRLVHWGLVRDGDASGLEVRSLLGDEGELTPAEQSALSRVQADVMAALLKESAVQVSYRPHYVDPRLFSPKAWRDVYHYDSEGQLLGWTRYGDEGFVELNARGQVILEKDDDGEWTRAQPVRYVWEGGGGGHLRMEPVEGAVESR